jgi:Bacterial protein of unknown function (HtrL_YibB)
MEHYYKHMPKTFELLKDRKLVFFYEQDDILEYVNGICKTPHFMSIKIPAIDLPTYPMSEDFLNSCKKQDTVSLVAKNDTKGVIHYLREYLQSGEDSYRKVISIWTSKILLIEKIINENPYKTNNFAWADVAISRVQWHYNMFNRDFDKTKINTFVGGARSLYMGEITGNIAGYMISHKDTWKKLFPIYKEKMEQLKHSNYAHDEETILHLIRKGHPELLAGTFGEYFKTNIPMTVKEKNEGMITIPKVQHKAYNYKETSSTNLSSKIIIFGYPHTGTSILKSIMGHIDEVDEIIDETKYITNTSPKKYILCKYPWTLPEFFDTPYQDFIKIFIIRNPLWVFSSINKRFNGNIPDSTTFDHSLETYINTLKNFIYYRNNKIPNLYLIRYEDMFDNDYQPLKDIFNSIGLTYTNKIFNNTEFKNKMVSRPVQIPKEEPKNVEHVRYRTYQINQPFVNMNDPSKIDLTEEQKALLQNNEFINELYPEIKTIL